MLMDEKFGCDASGANTPDLMPAYAWRGDFDLKEESPGASGRETPRGGVAKVFVTQLNSRLLAAAASAAAMPKDGDAESPAFIDLKQVAGPPPAMQPVSMPPPPGLWLPAPSPAPSRAAALDRVQLVAKARGLCPYSVFRQHAGDATSREPVISMGTVGHPNMCAEPCDAEVCQLGAACPKCHLCKAQRAPQQGGHTFAAEASAKSMMASFMQAQAASPVPECPSVGSMGHPHTCADACKYQFKHSACKDGRNCVRCHLCPWRRQPGRSNKTR